MDSLSPGSALSATPRLWAALRDRTFRSLIHRDYRLYFFGQIVSFIGSWMQSTALMWLVYDLTDDPLWPALLLVAFVGPTLLLGPIGGAIVDRVPKRQLIMITQAGFLITAIILTMCVGLNVITPVLLLVIQLANGIVQAVDLPARLAFVPDLVPRTDLINAVSLNAMLFNSARFLGPALTGLIYLGSESASRSLFPSMRPTTFGALVCFGLNAVSFAAVLIALQRITVGRTRIHRTDSSRGKLGDGLAFLRQNLPLAGLIAVTGGLCIFAWPVITLLPAYTRSVIGLQEKAFSLFVSSLGGGALLAALTTATLGSVGRRRRLLGVGTWTTTAGVLALSFVSSPITAALSCALIGYGLILFLSTGQATMQLRAPDERRGKVMALWAMTLSASAPLGHLFSGLAAQTWGVSPVLSVLSIGCAGVSFMVTVLVAEKGLKG